MRPAGAAARRVAGRTVDGWPHSSTSCTTALAVRRVAARAASPSPRPGGRRDAVSRLRRTSGRRAYSSQRDPVSPVSPSSARLGPRSRRRSRGSKPQRHSGGRVRGCVAMHPAGAAAWATRLACSCVGASIALAATHSAVDRIPRASFRVRRRSRRHSHRDRSALHAATARCSRSRRAHRLGAFRGRRPMGRATLVGRVWCAGWSGCVDRGRASTGILMFARSRPTGGGDIESSLAEGSRSRGFGGEWLGRPAGGSRKDHCHAADWQFWRGARIVGAG